MSDIEKRINMVHRRLDVTVARVTALEEANAYSNAPEAVDSPDPPEPPWYKKFRKFMQWQPWLHHELEFEQRLIRTVNAILAEHKPPPVKLYVWSVYLQVDYRKDWYAQLSQQTPVGPWVHKGQAVMQAMEIAGTGCGIEIVEGKPPEGET